MAFFYTPNLASITFRSLAVAIAVYCGSYPAAYCGDSSVQTEPSRVVVTVLDQTHLPVADAAVTISARQQPIANGVTTTTGQSAFSGLPAVAYTVIVSKEGFDTVVQEVECGANGRTAVEVTLTAAGHTDSVDVRDTPSPVDAATAPSTTVAGDSVKQMPSRPATVGDVLPLLPGIARQPDGSLQLSGAGEHRSAMLVNAADVTDPATGDFGLTVPIDRVETVDYYQTSYLAEYGRFSAGLVSVETKRAGEQRKWELNDPLPEFAIRSWRMRGLRTATPRLNFDTPIVGRKLYLSEGFEYDMRKTLVHTLPFPNNQKKLEGFNSFTQLDWIASDRNLLTATFHMAPQRSGFVNLNYFTPQPTTPDASTHSYTGSISDKWSVLGGVWDNTVSGTRFDATVWPKGTLDYVVQPETNSGNYFVNQARDAERWSWSSSFLFREWKRYGTHNLKAGSYLAVSHEDHSIWEHPIDIKAASGRLLERIAFTPGTLSHDTDTETAFYGQDHWVFTSHVSADLGIRVEHQRISSAFRVGPRAALVWNPSARLGTTIRAGLGVFYDRVPLGVYAFDQYPKRVVTSYDEAGAVISGPIAYVNALGEASSHGRLTFGRDAAGNFSPASTTSSIHVEQPLTTAVRLRVGYMQTISSGLVTLDSTPPNEHSRTGAYVLSGCGSARYRQVDVTARVRPGDKGELIFSYVHSRARGDLNDFAAYTGSFPTAIIHPNQVATLPTDLPNRFLAWGTLNLGHKFGIAPVFEYRSGQPYSVVNELQEYATTPYSVRFPRFLSADARVWRDFKVSEKRSIRLSVTGFNLTNHFNPEATHFNTGDPAYGLFFGERHRRFTADFDVIF